MEAKSTKNRWEMHPGSFSVVGRRMGASQSLPVILPTTPPCAILLQNGAPREHFGSQFGSKIDEKSVQKSMRKSMQEKIEISIKPKWTKNHAKNS